MSEQAAKSKAHILEMVQQVNDQTKLSELEGYVMDWVQQDDIPADLEAYMNSDAFMEECYQSLQRMKAGEYGTLEDLMEAGRQGIEEGLKQRKTLGLDD